MMVSEYEKVKHYMLLYLVVDTCGSMAGEKMEMVNNVISSLLSGLVEKSEENDISTYVKVMVYGTGAHWINENPVEVVNLTWENLSASGLADMGMAFKLLATDFEKIKAHGINFHPMVILFSHGWPTDTYIIGLNKLKEQRCFKKAVKIAIEIGDEADKKALEQFTGNVEAVLHMGDISTKVLLRMIRPYDDDGYYDQNDYDYVGSFWDLYCRKSPG